jgi:hypothetical protein
MAIRFEATITQTSVKPNFEPPAMFVAKFPGSMYATQASERGAQKRQQSHPRVARQDELSRARRASRLGVGGPHHPA